MADTTTYRRRWAKGDPACPLCGGDGRVRGRGVNKDGSLRKCGRWERCSCVPTRPSGSKGRRSKSSVILRGAVLSEPVEYPEGFVRPRTRGDCAGLPRPCPLVGCKYNLFLHVERDGRGVVIPRGAEADPRDVPEKMSCVLDMVDERVGEENRGCTLEEVGEALLLTRERVRQIEVAAVTKVRKRAAQFELARDAGPGGGEDNKSRVPKPLRS